MNCLLVQIIDIYSDNDDNDCYNNDGVGFDSDDDNKSDDDNDMYNRHNDDDDRDDEIVDSDYSRRS